MDGTTNGARASRLPHAASERPVPAQAGTPQGQAATRIHPVAASRAIVAAILTFAAGPAAAEPLLGSGRDLEGLRVYADHPDVRTFYYAPGKLAIALDRTGQPQLSFLQMRYTGSAASGDRGAFRTMSNLSFRVRMEGLPPERLAKARAALGAGTVLKPLPIRKVTTALNYVALGADAPPPPKPAGEGKLEEAEDAKPGEGYWTERIFNLSPDDATSAALWENFEKGRVQLSLSYAYYSDGLWEPPIPGRDPGPKGPHPVRADTLSITVDPARDRDRLRRIDVDQSIPAQYAAVSVACYDFNNELRPDLQVKVVEIEAKSINGRPMKREVLFSRATPDVTSASLRFPFAVSLKSGYRYRCREITPAGEETVRPWREGKPWSQLLDVTTPPSAWPAMPASLRDNSWWPVYVLVGSDYVPEFERSIESVAVNVRKVYSTGADFVQNLRLDARAVKAGRLEAVVAYPRLGEGPSVRKFDYQVIWNIRGRKPLRFPPSAREWASSSDFAGLHLWPPLEQRLITIDVQRGELTARGISHVDVALEYSLAGRKKHTSATLHAGDLADFREIAFICDPKAVVNARVTWRHRDGRRSVQRMRVNDEFPYLPLSPPSPVAKTAAHNEKDSK